MTLGFLKSPRITLLKLKMTHSLQTKSLIESNRDMFTISWWVNEHHSLLTFYTPQVDENKLTRTNETDYSKKNVQLSWHWRTKFSHRKLSIFTVHEAIFSPFYHSHRDLTNSIRNQRNLVSKARLHTTPRSVIFLAERKEQRINWTAPGSTNKIDRIPELDDEFSSLKVFEMH